ncbi:sulfotransferase family protein [Gracilibacillus massiliensis]|uniref:sulfotransferase family protein n=1 Tax=Gracilibacillus massiliensis TaxID=1564956 RepID=UPI00071E3917|nr:sulfotransferase [Gracilibacillus massiliensis]
MTNKIFITGVPRSGTTFLGRTLAFSKDIIYLWEPFNEKYRKGIPDYYPFISKNSSESKLRIYNKLIDNTINFRELNSNVTVYEGDGFLKKNLKQIGLDWTFFRYKLAMIKKFFMKNRTTLIKDPIGIFLTEHLISEYDFKVVITMRHPAAIVNARKKLKWEFDFNWWEQQKDLNKEHFSKIKSKYIGHLEEERLDVLDQSIIHWVTSYQYIENLKSKYPDNIFLVRHEDLCINPLTEFGKIFSFCGIEFNEKIKKKITKITTGETIEKKTNVLANLERRKAEDLVYKWKKNTTEADLNRIKKLTYPIGVKYYNEKHYWEL